MLFTIALSANACTIFSAADESGVWVGNNEDWNNLENSVFFFPPAGNKYGRMIIRMDKKKVPFGGMNDQGLFFDWCALPRRSDIVFPEDRLNYNGTLCEKMLAECANVEEVIHLYKTYNDPWLYEGHILIADKTGASAIIEWGSDSLEVIRKEGPYQVLTNFNITKPELAGWYPCQRYTKANEMLQQLHSYSVERFRQILQAVHQEGSNQTIYSNIYDLQHGVVYIYSMHQYDNAVVIDLDLELSKGENHYPVPDIFSRLSLVHPTPDFVLESDSVTLKWQGDAVQYRIYCSPDSLFQNCSPVIAGINLPNQGETGLIFVAFAALFVVVACNKKCRWIPGLAMMLLMAFYSCEKNESENIIVRQPIRLSSYKLERLNSGIRYYWKIDAINSAGIITESSIRKFTTP
jgi:hypothetical protein